MAGRLPTVLRALRQQRGWSQAELAKRAKVTDAYVAQLETGKRWNPSLEVLRRLAKALGVAPADLHPGRRLMDPREVVRRLKLGEVLREATLGVRTWEWFEGKVPKEYPDPERAAATEQLARSGLIHKIGEGEQPRAPRTYRATALGREFFEKNKLGSSDWMKRLQRIRFPEPE